MLEIKNVKVYDLEESIVRSGYAMSTGELANNFENEVRYLKEYLQGCSVSEVSSVENLKRGKKHFERAITLGNAKNGSGHCTYLSGIRVSFDLKYPEYISPELQRYHWFDIITSESKMQRLTKMDIKNSVNKYVDDIVIDNLNKWIDIYNRFNGAKYIHISNNNGVEEYRFFDEEDGVETKHKGIFYTKYEVFMKIISNCPLGLEKWMAISTNYLQLKTIRFQRKGHPLKEDYTVLLDMIENLPYFKDLCLGGLNAEN